MPQSVTRRQLVATLTTAASASFFPASAAPQPLEFPVAPAATTPPFTLCLNMSTIRGHKLGLVKELETASKAGFKSVEIWIDSLQEYLKSGGTVADLRKRLADLNIRVENAIGFAPWIVDDEAVRTKGVDQLKREMELLTQIGCKRVATPSVGAQAPDAPVIDLRKAADRYRAILEVGDQTGVVPQLEMWGFARNLTKLSDVMYVAVESGHPSARLLLDIYHIFKGGSSIDSLPLIGKPAIEVFHVNDYPASLTRQAIGDADRVYPGDGVAPIQETLKRIKDPSKSIVLSLEVFNKSYYAQDALTVAKTSMEKMKKMIAGV